VDLGQASNPIFVKTSMFEALLYVLSAPFAHEYMKVRRATYGNVDRRGPEFLYIYGPSHNGKSSFLRFALKLLSGYNIDPIPGNQLTKARVDSAVSVGTVFPLVFDDVTPTQTQSPSVENLLKSYWENSWKDSEPRPQIIMSSNAPTLKEWAKSRVKRVDFNVHFPSTAQNKTTLVGLFSQSNELFKWFSELYLDHLQVIRGPSDDQLSVARAVINDLYEYAERTKPRYLPSQPLESIYDSARETWQELLNMKKAKITSDPIRSRVDFDKDMQPREVEQYRSLLPQTLKTERKGNTVTIEPSEIFKVWLGGESRGPSWLDPFRRLWMSLTNS